MGVLIMTSVGRMLRISNGPRLSAIK